MFMAFHPVLLSHRWCDMYLDKRTWRSYRSALPCESNSSYKHSGPLAQRQTPPEQRQISQYVIT